MPTVTSTLKDCFGPSVTGGLQEQYQVFVTKIPVLVTESYLRHYFSVWVGGLKRIQIMSSNDKSPNSTYQALVEFCTMEALRTCLSKKYHEVTLHSNSGSKILSFECRECMSTSKRKQQTKQIMEEQRKVYLPSLPLEATEASIRAEMTNYGTVQDVEIIPKPEQGKKIAFIIFKEPLRGEQVANKSPLQIQLADGSVLKVECQIALNPQQLHARKQTKPRKDSNDASTEDEEYPTLQKAEKTDKQPQFPKASVALAVVPEKKTADAGTAIGPIGFNRPGQAQHKPCRRVPQIWFPFGNGVFQRPVC